MDALGDYGEMYYTPDYTTGVDMYVSDGNQVVFVSPGGSGTALYIVQSYAGSWSRSSTDEGSNGLDYTIMSLDNAFQLGVTAGVPVLLFSFNIECAGGDISLMVNGDPDRPQGSLNYGNNFAVVSLVPNYNGDTYAGNTGTGIECTALPLDLVSFDGVQKDCQIVNLNWSIKSEFNSDRFVIERAIGNTDSFKSIGSVNSKRTSTSISTYSFIDADIPEFLSDDLIYYRLKQIDSDGNYDYSMNIVVKYHCDNRKDDISFYPNPVAENLMIDFRGFNLAKTDNVKVELYNYLGKIVINKVIDTNKSLKQYDLHINESVPAGAYLCRILVNNKIVKSNRIDIIRK